MVIRLLDINHEQSQYDRPSSAKVCGLARFGQGCELGPDGAGRCPGRTQCVPYRKGDRWECTRTRASGGKCESGPTPDGRCQHLVQCVPSNNVRFVRRRIVAFSLLALFAVLMLMFTSGSTESVLSPGPLSNAHAGIGSLDCEACHEVDFNSPTALIAAAFEKSTVNQGNHACLACHKLGAQADLAHGVGTEILGTDRVTEIACSTCHQEHKGANVVLNVASNARCDSCHTVAHDPFVGTHPPFEHYVANPASMILFNHPKHFGTHFPKSETPAPTSCNSCHVVVSEQGKMGVKSFAQICSDCHDKDVRSLRARSKGIPVLNVPALDLETLREHGVEIGSWPAGAEEPYITPIMAALIARNRQIGPILQRIMNEEIDLSDLSEATPGDLVMVAQVAREIKLLISDLVSEGHSFLARNVTSRTITPIERDRELLASLPLDLVATAARAWFGDLDRDVTAFRNNGKATTVAHDSNVDAVSSTNIDKMDLGGWYLDGFQVAYRPAGHADPFVESWLHVSNRLQQETMNPEFRSVYSLLTSRSTPGACVKCHALTVDFSNDLHWESSALPDNDFTGFNHRVHFLVVGNAGCLTCHKSSDDGAFQPIDKSACDSCHVPGSAGDTCVTCHDYHLGGFRTVLPDTSIQQLLDAGT